MSSRSTVLVLSVEETKLLRKALTALNDASGVYPDEHYVFVGLRRRLDDELERLT